MTPQEAIQTIRVVRASRARGYFDQARRMEIDLCRQLWLDLTPDAPEVGAMLALFRDKPREDLQSVCIGIIQGRSGDGPFPWKLRM